MTKKCPVCGTKFTLFKGQIKETCSRSCGRLYVSEESRGRYKMCKICQRKRMMKHFTGMICDECRIGKGIKRRAHYRLQSAVKWGKQERKPCQVCGDKAQGHHEDYSKPLEVIWLCQEHHSKWHTKDRTHCKSGLHKWIEGQHQCNQCRNIRRRKAYAIEAEAKGEYD